jgi:2-keto-4-pentenoate hydratase/2-oxohepta-3-ene-1,7-dioic acid hydratase in catechol pathway
MRIVRYDSGTGPRWGTVEDGKVVDGGRSLSRLEPATVVGKLEDTLLLAPVPRSAKVIAVGLNYRDHAQESGQPIPESPILFAKFSSSVTGPGSPIQIPAEVDDADYEAELGVVISSSASRVGVDKAFDYVLGYTCVNDVSARGFQFADGQWVRGKSLDTFCPIGPWVVTTDEIPDPQSLSIKCRVNGETLQDSSTKQMVFTVAQLVSFISTWITLEAGDLISTGTPPGVGFARKPPKFLSDGDVVEVEIEGVGILSNPVITGSAAGR